MPLAIYALSMLVGKCVHVTCQARSLRASDTSHLFSPMSLLHGKALAWSKKQSLKHIC
jgi:hypothetical protein